MEKRKFLALCAVGLISFLLVARYITFHEVLQPKKSLRLAVEFVDHAACAFIARNKGFFEKNGLEPASFDCYIAGTALAAALGREDIDAAYMCLIPAVSTYANAKVPIKIVAGIHKYGYALVVNQSRVGTVKDLENPDVRIACPAKGSPPDVLLHKMVEDYSLDAEKILRKVQYMPSPKAFLALKMGLVDAIFCPEQYPTMAEKLGFRVLLTAQDLWPYMQGSVLVVKESLIEKSPETVEKLVKVTLQATSYIYENPEDSAQIVAQELQGAGRQVFPLDVAEAAAELQITSEIILRSLTVRLVCSNDVDLKAVQEAIDYMAKLGYIERFQAEDILDLRFLGGNWHDTP